MSWITCTACKIPINTDDDPDAYCGERTVGKVKMDIWLCEDCRDHAIWLHAQLLKEKVNETL